MSAFFEEFGRVGVYKRSQGRIVRQVTFAALALALLIGLWRLVLTMRGYGEACPPWLCYGLPGVLAVFGLWAAYRSVNLPAFADFLIAVEAEMNKVSWPSRGELYRHSVVVLVVLFMLTVVLFGFDIVWAKIFQVLRVIPR